MRTENQDAPLGTLRNPDQERVVQVQARVANPAEFAQIIVARRNGQPVRLGQVARVVDGTVEQENLALYNGERTLLLQVQKRRTKTRLPWSTACRPHSRRCRPNYQPGIDSKKCRTAHAPSAWGGQREANA